ncbi:MAG: 4-hydroxy-3-methylbut-2-enyl diphosphate reductase [Dehalococcoidia bacterium]|nr:4-hydroxy-3-methylbut-2-enyl diphosphate reductase [Dehalococcoidia bacterium]
MDVEILRASEMGFCPGVRRAIEMARKAAAEGGQIQSLGALVHNRWVVSHLAEKGIRVAQSLDQVSAPTVVISSHGVGPQTIEAMRTRGLRIVDTTCTFVRSAQEAAENLAEAGFMVVIYGDAAHPEIQGVLGWARGGGVATLDAATVGRLPRKVGLLSQTTQSPAGFAGFAGKLLALGLERTAEFRVFNTICSATQKRQAAALDVARRVDLMIVVGGHDSANTRRLAEVCASTGVETHHIETADELAPRWFARKARVGLTAGASTADATIEEVELGLTSLCRPTGTACEK